VDITEKNIAVLILFFEKLELTKRCIQGFLDANVNIYILNNHSSDESFAKLKIYCKPYQQVNIYNSERFFKKTVYTTIVCTLLKTMNFLSGAY